MGLLTYGLNLNLPISKVETIIITMQFLQGLKEKGCGEVLSTAFVFCKVPFSPSRPEVSLCLAEAMKRERVNSENHCQRNASSCFHKDVGKWILA